MRISNHYFAGRSRVGWPGYDRQRWQWQPTLDTHDPNPPLTLETGGAPADVLLVVADMAVAVSAESPDLVQQYLLAVAEMAVPVGAESPALIQANVLAVSDVAIAVTAESPSLIEAALLTVADATVGVSADSPDLVQQYLLAVPDMALAVSADHVDLIVPKPPVSVPQSWDDQETETVDAFLLALAVAE